MFSFFYKKSYTLIYFKSYKKYYIKIYYVIPAISILVKIATLVLATIFSLATHSIHLPHLSARNPVQKAPIIPPGKNMAFVKDHSKVMTSPWAATPYSVALLDDAVSLLTLATGE